MKTTRQEVFETLDELTEAKRKETTTLEYLAAELHTDRDTILDHVKRLEECALVRTGPDGRMRVTITGEELLALDLDEAIVANPRQLDREV